MAVLPLPMAPLREAMGSPWQLIRGAQASREDPSLPVERAVKGWGERSSWKIPKDRAGSLGSLT